MVDGRHIENHFFGYNSAPCCLIKTKFGARRQNRTHTKVWRWKCQISKIQHGGRTPCSKSFFGYNSAPYCPIKMKFGVRRQNHTSTKVRWSKCPITKIHYSGRRHFENRISPYLSRESFKFNEIWYANPNFDTAKETWQAWIWNQYKKRNLILKTTKFKSNVLEAISKLRLKKQQKITFLF